MDESKENVEATSSDITSEITARASKIDIGSAATADVEQIEADDEEEVQMIEEHEDISGADMPGNPDEEEEDENNDPDYSKFEDPRDIEINGESSSSSSDSDEGYGESHDGSNRTGTLQDEASNCSTTSENPSENANDSGQRNFFTKRTSQQSRIPYNFQLMTQELSSGQSKFMENFDPERSNREKRKLTRKISTKKATLYDDMGLMGIAQLDICDCMSEECPGCHFPCPKCFSNKCGHECRQNRRWMYEEMSIEGTDVVIRNSAYYSVSNAMEQAE